MPVLLVQQIAQVQRLAGTLFHLAAHIGSFVRQAASRPDLIVRYFAVAFVSVRCLGPRRTASKVASRVRRWLSVDERDGCPVCAWARRPSTPGFSPEEARWWLSKYRPSATLLEKFRARAWPADAPTFTVLMPVFDPEPGWLRAAIRSVRAQTYPRWQLVCVDDGSRRRAVRRVLEEEAAADGRIQVVRLSANHGVSAASNRGLRAATGDYVAFLDHDDVLEPQALHRFAEAVLENPTDLIYSDEATTGPDIEDVWSVCCRPAFSYDYYLSNPYFVHFVAVRRALLREVGGFDESLPISHDVDLLLRVMERAAAVTHVPEVLYRWRTTRRSLGHAKQDVVDEVNQGIFERHLRRLGCDATVRPVRFNFRDVAFRPPAEAKVAVIIPTRNQADKLGPCLASLRATLPPGLADVVVVNHRSDEPATLDLLADVRRSGRVLDWDGAFNFSEMMNFAVDAVRGPYTHYLFLNNDTEATGPGWLEHMVGLAGRPDVGVVGPFLLYPNGQVQHAGVVVGLFNCAEHYNKFAAMYDDEGERDPGPHGVMLCTRDVTAVTGAALLIRADVFDALDGFDPSLAVGFGDTDLCLRARRAGLKVLIDPHAVLIHHESVTRGKTSHDPHPEDSGRFLKRYRKLIRAGDPFYNPHFLRDCHLPVPSQAARAPEVLPCRTTAVELPGRTSVRAEAKAPVTA